jgi:8-oxo-dGTP pyrophosphatase MutT (NUDIX family)
MIRNIIVLLYKVAFRLNEMRFFVLRPLTMGVKILLIRDDKVLLVRHTYQRGWFLPGGGVKRGETLEEAIRREASEELGAVLVELEFVGMYASLAGHKQDHIAVFQSHQFSLSGKKDYEIETAEFFPLRQLPMGTATGGRHRIQEYLEGKRPLLPTNW